MRPQVQAIAEIADQHVDTRMPDFTYLQHAQPTTLGHFLLGFAYPVLRRPQRTTAARTNDDEDAVGRG